MGKRKLVAASAATLLVLTWGVLAAQSPSSRATPSKVDAGTETIRLNLCQTYWADERIISSKIPGKIDRRLVDDGAEVREGDVLALLDARDAEIELAIQEILGSSELDEKAQQAKLKEYIARLDASSRLIGYRAISEEEHRLAKVNVEVNQILTLKEAEKRLIEQRKADRARIFLDDHVIRSPMRAIVKKCFKREKESLATGDLQVFHLVATDKVWVQGSVPVKYLYRVKVDQPVVVHLAINELESGIAGEVADELPQEKIPFRGIVKFIDPSANFSGGKFDVRAEVDNQYDESGAPILRAGLSAVMTIHLTNQTGEKAAAKN